MKRDTEATILILVGIFTGRVVLEGVYRSYVKEGLFWPLILSVVTIVVVGLLSLRKRHEAAAVEGAHDHEHADHGHGSGRVGFLLLVPVAVLVLIAPSPLGADAAARASANQIAQPTAFEYPDLPEARDGASDVTLLAVLSRSLATVDSKLEGNPVRLTGFVVPDPDVDDGYRLTRFTLGCCASDASALSVRIIGVDAVPAADTWQEVVAVWNGRVDDVESTRLPVLELVSSRTIEEPAQPYE